ncbi:family 16 glycosylhydrolase [Clostridium estertheticum]|uniref:Family 16 glycosylhydrolase n=1 Tax=Clostridium estertheticum TaxID=238834 RepID=A0AA47I9N0_9CLOT|nr:family 16 glycosylhydrolase [Clostridium estertheticum]WAG63070.1 family 16 glycosylhydrolase [Clostridium estertheticum]
MNTSNWAYETGSGGWGNNELEYYTNRSDNARIENSNLIIEAKKESYGGMGYTSARLKTQGLKDFTYGKVEAKIKLTKGQGIWPAFWMLGSNIPQVNWPACGEIDIMEHINNEAFVHSTIHWDYNGHATYGNPSNNINVTQYHVYGIEWDTNSIKWSIDGTQYMEANITNNINGTDEFHKPFFILLNLAVGGQWPGNPDGSTPFPARMYVDYVHVYQQGSVSSKVTTPALSVQGGQYTTAQTVKLSCSTSGATIRYTLDGSTPNINSSVYSAPITISSTTTLKTYASKSGFIDSEVVTAQYTINAPPAQDYTYGMYKKDLATGIIWLKSNVNSAWADVHYTINGGGLLNYRMTYNSSTTGCCYCIILTYLFGWIGKNTQIKKGLFSDKLTISEQDCQT